jgi:hypothetical protein
LTHGPPSWGTKGEEISNKFENMLYGGRLMKKQVAHDKA